MGIYNCKILYRHSFVPFHGQSPNPLLALETFITMSLPYTPTLFSYGMILPLNLSLYRDFRLFIAPNQALIKTRLSNTAWGHTSYLNITLELLKVFLPAHFAMTLVKISITFLILALPMMFAIVNWYD